MKRLRNSLFIIALCITLISCGEDEQMTLDVEDGQINFMFEDSVYLISDPIVEKTTTVSHSGPEVSVITISGQMSETHSFTIWVRNYIDEPLDCILKSNYYVEESVSLDNDLCVLNADNELFCNAASMTYSVGNSTYGTESGTVTISECQNQLKSGTFESSGFFESGAFKNLNIQ